MAIKKSDLYSSLWASCDELRGGMDASQYNGLRPVRASIRQIRISDHGAVSHSAVQDFLVREGISRNSAQYLSAILVRTMES